MHYKDYKTIISAQGNMNIYRGCSHGCIYCDSRSVCYQFTHDFEDIEIKRNAPQILEQQLKRRRNICVIGTGSMCDPYIHLEEDLGYTRQCLEVIEKYGYGVAILTKSARILRDLDILKRINEKSKCVVQITLTTHDEKLCSIIEPHVSTTYERFKILETMSDNGIPTVVWLCPVLPFINDTTENINGIIDYCIKAKVKGILCFNMGVTLREGDREYFYKKLDEHFPGVKQKYIKHFGNAYSCASPDNNQLMKHFKNKCKNFGIMYETNEVFSYMYKFEKKEEQISFEI